MSYNNSLQIDFEKFAHNLDAAMQAHLEWTRRVLRCAVLGASPGDDALKDKAHTLCRFGRWFAEDRQVFEVLDTDRTRSLDSAHQAMHVAIRNICTAILKRESGNPSDLDSFEITQSELIDLLAHFKTLAINRNSHIDALTGLPLRHHIEDDFNLLSRLDRRHDNALGVIMLDIDHFKTVNDQYGHSGGDTVLQHLAECLLHTLRESDRLYRYGGEEFLMLANFSATEVTVVVERVLEAVRALSIPLSEELKVHITVTLGIALVARDENMINAIQRSDEALYKGKESGRNCYVVAPDPG